MASTKVPKWAYKFAVDKQPTLKNGQPSTKVRFDAEDGSAPSNSVYLLRAELEGKAVEEVTVVATFAIE